MGTPTKLLSTPAPITPGPDARQNSERVPNSLDPNVVQDQTSLFPAPSRVEVAVARVHQLPFQSSSTPTNALSPRSGGPRRPRFGARIPLRFLLCFAVALRVLGGIVSNLPAPFSVSCVYWDDASADAQDRLASA